MEGSLQFLEQAGKVMTAVDYEKWSIYVVYTSKTLQMIMVATFQFGKQTSKKQPKKNYKPTSWVNS